MRSKRNNKGGQKIYKDKNFDRIDLILDPRAGVKLMFGTLTRCIEKEKGEEQKMVGKISFGGKAKIIIEEMRRR